MKREDGGPGRSLANEFTVHMHLLQVQQTRGCQVLIPACYGMLREDDEDWKQILPQLPDAYISCNALINERIPAIGLRGRQQLVDRYCPAERRKLILEDPNNNDCLVRVYLGRRRRMKEVKRGRCRPSIRPFSLRNIPLHIDQFPDVGLDPLPYARGMADALCFLWWIAKIDGNDVEFVLGGPRRASPGAVGSSSAVISTYESDVLGWHAMWMLDFDCCKPLSWDDKGVEQAMRCFWRNDPYFPRPPAADSPGHDMALVLWKAFAARFLETSREMLKDEDGSVRKLPALVMEKIVQTRGAFSKAAFVLGRA